MTTISPVELGVLGPLQVRQHGLPVAVPGAKPRAILTMLGLHGSSVVSADTLAELLWGARPPRTAAKALQTHISSLRRALGDGFVLTEGSGWTLNTTEIDAVRYKLAARLGREAVASGDATQAMARFEEALSLWRGIPELPDGPRAVSEKTRWIEGHAALVEDRADALLATGRAAEIVGELEAAIADAPLRERRWGQLMLALYRAGRQGEALAAYQRARSLLADELGVDPGPNLRRLEAAIVAQDPALEIPVSQQLSAVTKAVTFLLTDIEGSTAAWEAQADAMAVALARHDEIVEQIVTARGGRLVKTRGEGDATFSVFDRPSAAAAAAIELQEAIRHEPWTLANPMRIRVSLHTGEVELRAGDYFGRAVNRAARLRSLAAGGQILCSGATAELVIDTLADDVVLADLGMRHLKNLARPEHVFELRLEAAEESDAAEPDSPMPRPSLPAVLTGPGPFVGRGEELAGLLTAWQSTLTVGTRAVLVAGEPGVGKTRLAGEWSRQVYDDGAVVLYGRCDEDLGAAYQPFAEALRSLVPCLGADRLRGLRGVEALLPLVPGLSDVVPDLPTPSRSDPDTERYALFDAVVALLGAASASAPIVLILDDLHWAAKPTLLLLRHLLRFGEQARVQIVGTYRSTDLDRSHPLAAMLSDLHRDGSATRLALTGLDQKDVSAYVSEAGYNDEELARALASVTGGNPFFLIEALRHVDESGGRWDPNTLPQGVREAVSRRLSRLPEETNKALAAAAVVGSRFAVELVERVVDGDLVDAFDEASKAGIVIEEPGGRYRFNHALVRQSLLAELPSVRRMRLHQRIAVTLEADSSAEDELLAELAYHYFECAWAGNAAKAVEYCQRAADQAMTRLAYEGAADLYDRALHALEELDDELPDRDALQAELLVARCEALLAAGDVGSAAGAVAQLQQAAGDSVRLAAWGTCFDGELSMLTNPERLDEIEAAVGAAAEKLAGLEDAAGEAKAHTVRAACLARLGRIGDAETALDQALTAARRAHDHRRVNAVLAGAPLAALWGPNPVPRAGGRCLDVVRLLRITTGSPVVEATSTRCQGVLDALRGRAAAGRALIDSARRSLTELGMRHALLEVDQFAGLVELVADDPAAAEPLLRRAYDGFKRMGVDADTAESAAFLARACLLLDRDAEANELCSESERLSGHALRPSITWRTVRAQLLARGGELGEARRVAEEAVSIAERTDALVSHGDACLMLAVVLSSAGEVTAANAAAEQAVALFERKGAAALVERAREIIGSEASAARTVPETLAAAPENECVRVIERLNSAAANEAWAEYENLYAADVVVESRRKVVGFAQVDLPTNEWPQFAQRFAESGTVRHRMSAVEVRGERLALLRLEIGSADTSIGAPKEEVLELDGIDDEGRIVVRIWFDVEDMDAAVAELDARHARVEQRSGLAAVEPVNACVRALRKIGAAFDRDAWDEISAIYAVNVEIDNRRKIVGYRKQDLPSDDWPSAIRRLHLVGGAYHMVPITVRGKRLALVRLEVGTADNSPGAPRDECLQLSWLDDQGRIAQHVFFDVEDLDTAMAELDAQQAWFESQRASASTDENACVRSLRKMAAAVDRDSWNEVEQFFAPTTSVESRRRLVGFGRIDLPARKWPREIRRYLQDMEPEDYAVIATRGERLALIRFNMRAEDASPGAPQDNMLELLSIDEAGLIDQQVWFDDDDLDAAFAELEARYLAGEAAPYAQVWRSGMDTLDEVNRHEPGPILSRLKYTDHRRVSFGSADFPRAVEELWALVPDARYRTTSVHALGAHGTVATLVIEGTASSGNELQWSRIVLLLPDEPRMEVYDDDDLNAALVRFEELAQPIPGLENAATRVWDRLNTHFSSAEWAAMSQLVAPDMIDDDRRRTVNGGVRRGRDIQIANGRAVAETGADTMGSSAVAIRGGRLALFHSSFFVRGEEPDGFRIEFLSVVEVDASERVVAHLAFDLDDVEAAFAEFESRYIAGEAAAHAHTWSVIVQGFDAINRRQLPAISPDFVDVDHRQGAGIESGDLLEYLGAGFDDMATNRLYVESVHQLTAKGAIVTHVATGTSHGGLEVEWRLIDVLTIDGDLLNRCEMFDETDLDSALARFDELDRPGSRLENPASHMYETFLLHYTTGDWEALSSTMADDFVTDDRRRFVGVGGRQIGRAAAIEHARITSDLGVRNSSSTVLATRGQRLALARGRFWGRDELPDAFNTEVLHLVEINTSQQITAFIAFDLDELDSAFEELEARYLASEAAPHAHTWSVITEAYAEFNRNDYVSVVNVDHRKAVRFEPGELTTADMKARMPNLRSYMEVVHRLSDVGVVVTGNSVGSSEEGFEAEWRMVLLLTVSGDMLAWNELFDETDLDAALARFDELDRPVPQLTNAALAMADRFLERFAVRDWGAMAQLLADDICLDDRRRVINADLQIGRDLYIDNFRVAADIGATQTLHAIATRGDRLVLSRARFARSDGSAEEFGLDLLHIVELDADGLIAATVTFDPDDLDAAFDELNARYAAGEAASYSAAWSVITRAYAAVKRHELPAWTPDAVNIDHRRGTAFAPGELSPYLHATWDQTPDVSIYIETVHRLSESGVLVTHVANGTSQQGFEGEWREVTLSTIDDDRINRSEMFDESDLDTALARFDELSRPVSPVTNKASLVEARCQAYIAAEDWDELAAAMADDVSIDDRRRVVNAGLRRGRDVVIDDLRVGADIGLTEIAPIAIATRGERLTLRHISYSGRDHRQIDLVQIVEINGDDQIAALVLFDPDDLDAAFTELDTRYLAGEAAPHAHTYSVIADAFAAVNRRELPSITADLASIDHRRPVAFAPGELIPYLQASLNDAPDIRIRIDHVHRLSDLGAVVTHVWHNTSQQGFDAEWQLIGMSMVDGDLINRCELFDEADLDAALARFDELSQGGMLSRTELFEEENLDAAPAKFDELSAPRPRLENAVTRASIRFDASFGARDWNAISSVLAEDVSTDDRRRVIGSARSGRDAEIANLRVTADLGAAQILSTVIAIRGDRLALFRTRMSDDDIQFEDGWLTVAEVDRDNRFAKFIAFDGDDVDAAFAELEARYISGEAAAHARTWEVVAGVFAAHNRGDLPLTTPNVASIDHRKVAGFAPGEGVDYLRAGWDTLHDISVYIEIVHGVTDLGAVFTWSGTGTSREGFAAAWRGINLVTVEGELVSRSEVFDEHDVGAAVARFDELNQAGPLFENTASRVCQRYRASFAERDWDAVAAMMADDLHNEDRRRVVNAGVRRGRETALNDLRAAADLEVPYFTATQIANRGERLALFRGGASYGDRPEAFHVEVLQLAEIDADDRLAALITFDLNDVDAAFAELDARYLAGEAAAHARTWSAITGAYAGMTRGELPPTSRDVVCVDHRRVAPMAAPDDGIAYLRASWDLAPDFKLYIESVHRLSDVGAVFTRASNATSLDGFDAEWRAVDVIRVEGDLISRGEIFDEGDLDLAIQRFDELIRPVSRLTNAATRLYERYWEYFARRDWGAFGALLSEDFVSDDRRRVVNSGVRLGRDADVANVQALAELGVTAATSTILATRGNRLALSRVGSEELQMYVLNLIEINEDGQISAIVGFDLDDVGGAFEELDARFMAGKANAEAHTWSLISQAISALNRHEIPPITPDWVNVDHRRGRSFDLGGFLAFARAAWEVAPDMHRSIEAVHRLNGRGAVFTHVAQGNSPAGFQAEWRNIGILTVDGDLINRLEVFDEDALDTAIARFNELSRPTRSPNAALQVAERYAEHFEKRDWDSLSRTLASDVFQDDRRRVVGSGLRHGREPFLADMHAVADLGLTDFSLDFLAARGERLVLTRTRVEGGSQRSDAVHVEMLGIVEIATDGRIAAAVSFDSHDLDAAFAELDSRYLTGEAAQYAQTWSVISAGFAALSRREVPPRTSDWAMIDHRKVTTFAAGDLSADIRAMWDLAPDVSYRIETVHRLNDLGAVVTYTASAVTEDGFAAEWRAIDLMTVKGEMFSSTELFDESDLDAALQRFDALDRPVAALANAASQINDQFDAHFAARDWDAMSQMMADEYTNDDRRHVVNGGVQVGRDAEIASMRAVAAIGVATAKSTVIAMRGHRLALLRTRFSSHDERPGAFHVEIIDIIETNADGLIVARVAFDNDEIDTAFEELDARYLAGEAAAYARTWSYLAGAFAALDRQELPSTAPDWVNIDHRQGVAFAPGDMYAYTRSGWDVTADLRFYVEAVHRLSHGGAVITAGAHGTSHEGVDVEWHLITVAMLEKGVITHCEIFDETDVDAALARFDEVTAPSSQVDNAAVRARSRIADAYNSRDIEAFGSTISRYEDRRRGLRDEGAADEQYARAILSGTPASWRVEIEAVAIRGDQLALTNDKFRDIDDPQRPTTVELLTLTEIDHDQQLSHTVFFDPDDIDAAFTELDARYLVGEAGNHAQTWAAIVRGFAEFGERELPAKAFEWIDHRSVIGGGTSDLTETSHAAWDMTRDMQVRIEVVHRLSERGAVITHSVHGTSQEGFDFELRMVDVLPMTGDLIIRCESFDEKDLDSALARFDELSSKAPPPDTLVTRVLARVVDAFDSRDPDKYLALFAGDCAYEDRRKGLRDAGSIRPGHAHTVTFGAAAGWQAEFEHIAVRGEHLMLGRATFRDQSEAGSPIAVEALNLGRFTNDEMISWFVVFDPDDIDSAYRELTACWIASGEVEHPEVIEAAQELFDVTNRHDWDELAARESGATFVNHRQLGTGDVIGDHWWSLRVMASLIRDMRVDVAEIPRHSAIGLVTNLIVRGTTSEGTAIELPAVIILLFDKTRVTRMEAFDLNQCDQALARFDELNSATAQLENSATRVRGRVADAYNGRDVERFLELAVGRYEDRRKGLRDEGMTADKFARAVLTEIPASWRLDIEFLAIRGDHLALSRETFRDSDEVDRPITVELLTLTEVDEHDSASYTVFFDPDDTDAALAELAARWTASR